MASIGYARVSTEEQTLDPQKDALTAAGCRKIFSDTITGTSIKEQRSGLTSALEYIREGEDTLVVWKLDRLGRSLRELIDTIEWLHAKHIGFRSLTEGFDTTTPGGMLIFHVMGALAEFERDLIRERTNAGLAAAKARGRLGGRRNSLSVEQVERLHQLYNSGQFSITAMCEMCVPEGISRATFYRYRNLWRQEEEQVS